MIDLSKIDYSRLDIPEILNFLFHPRPEWTASPTSSTENELIIQVDEDVLIGGRFHPAAKSAPNILFFHGNGEIVSDYDELGPVYNEIGINFLPVDYRGYGRSTGRPTVTSMIRDAHAIFGFVITLLLERGFDGPLIIMGRSLGSASALELSASYPESIAGLIIESGFARTMPLLRLLGIDIQSLGIEEDDGLGNIDKIRNFRKLTLIIHAEHDHIIPFEEGRALFDASVSEDKKMLQIPGANHNDILYRGLNIYMKAIFDLVKRIT